jgi:hypothetical protein
MRIFSHSIAAEDEKKKVTNEGKSCGMGRAD